MNRFEICYGRKPDISRASQNRFSRQCPDLTPQQPTLFAAGLFIPAVPILDVTRSALFMTALANGSKMSIIGQGEKRMVADVWPVSILLRCAQQTDGEYCSG
jgi:hypothetical protein